jgi:hypothetical protein
MIDSQPSAQLCHLISSFANRNCSNLPFPIHCLLHPFFHPVLFHWVDVQPYRCRCIPECPVAMIEFGCTSSRCSYRPLPCSTGTGLRETRGPTFPRILWSPEAHGYNPQALILNFLQFSRGCRVTSLVSVWLMSGVRLLKAACLRTIVQSAQCSPTH